MIPHRRKAAAAEPTAAAKTRRVPLAVLGLALALGACSGLSNKPPVAFDLTPPASDASAAKRGRAVLAVPLPTMLDAYSTERIVVQPTPGEIAQFGNAQWSDTLPRLIQSRLVQAFEGSPRLRAVGRAGDGLTPTHSLAIDVRKFHLSVATRTADVELEVKIVSERNGHVMASRVFRNAIASEGTDGPSAAAALDQAFGEITPQIVQWFNQAAR